MSNWRYLTLASFMALGMSFGLVGCPEDDTPCASDDDCVDPEVCEATCEICYTECTTNADCGDGETCQAVCDGSDKLGCKAGEGGGGSGGGGGNVPECDVDGDCIADAGYCSTEDTCVSNQCGTKDVNDCAQCGKGPDSGVRGMDGPVLYGAAQTDLDVGDGAVKCRKSAACAELQGNVCGFEATYYLAPGQAIDAGSTYSNIWLVTDKSKACTDDGDCAGTGGLTCKAGTCMTRTFEHTSAAAGKVTFEGCFDATLENIGAVMVLLDDNDHFSNALCFSGTAP